MTAPLVVRNSLSIHFRKDLNYPKKFLGLSNEMVNLLESSGVPSDKYEVLPNFIFDEYPDWKRPDKKNGRWIAVGRLVEEKGFAELLEVWPSGIELDIFGDGPLFKKLTDQSRDNPNIHVKGAIKREELVKLLPVYTGAVLPSRWFEPGALVILEFLSAGLPIVSLGVWSGAAGLNPDWHIDTESIVPNQLKDHLHKMIRKTSVDSIKLSLSQRQRYLDSFTPEKWYDNLEKILRA